YSAHHERGGASRRPRPRAFPREEPRHAHHDRRRHHRGGHHLSRPDGPVGGHLRGRTAQRREWRRRSRRHRCTPHGHPRAFRGHAHPDGHLALARVPGGRLRRPAVPPRFRPRSGAPEARHGLAASAHGGDAGHRASLHRQPAHLGRPRQPLLDAPADRGARRASQSDEALIASPLSASGLVVEAAHLRKTYGPTPALEDISLSLEPGQGLTLLGPNGTGKTTLLRILATLLRPTSGSLRIVGLDALKEPSAVRGAIDMVGHGTWIYEDLTAIENLRL